MQWSKFNYVIIEIIYFNFRIKTNSSELEIMKVEQSYSWRLILLCLRISIPQLHQEQQLSLIQSLSLSSL